MDFSSLFNANLNCPKCDAKLSINFQSFRNGKLVCQTCNHEIDEVELKTYNQEKEQKEAVVKPYNSKIELKKENDSFSMYFPPEGLTIEVVIVGLFMLIWGGGVVFFTAIFGFLAFSEPTMSFALLFLIPFWAVVVYMFYNIFFTIFGKSYLYTDKEYLVYKRVLFFSSSKKMIKINELKSSICDVVYGSKGGRTYFVTIYYGSQNNSLKIRKAAFSTTTKEECMWLANQINDFIKESKDVTSYAETMPEIIDNQKTELQWQWVITSVLIGLPILFACNALIYPFFGGIPAYFVIGLIIANWSPGKTKIEPVIGVIILTTLSLLVNLILLQTTYPENISIALNKFIEIYQNIIKRFNVEAHYDIKTLQIIVLSIIHSILSFLGLILTFMGASLGEYLQEKKYSST
ncbi:MAG: hypothetical protein A2086_15885 [Spirochaetes bacterium GWD1_27_9]|nr:MAG: hypothetical protein A2Z98_11155 [Spirochaetes bacterium GWB1_27_13]OHD24814.1 MAG: hypothetical protein A2Y34_08265 [Spirochaetes bacterium GWC1_27_15]OHD42859.1 MAG: hypothetical protein A2086_15885 [Spirochaetes bacterium GWD1_27_9]